MNVHAKGEALAEGFGIPPSRASAGSGARPEGTGVEAPRGVASEGVGPVGVPFLGVAAMAALVRRIGVEPFLLALAAAIEVEFLRWHAFEKVPRLATHAPEGVIELMPCSDERSYGFKYVNGHPGNAERGLQTVAAIGLLADVATGYPVLLCEMTLLTALRTAATSALAARHMAPPGATTMALVGNGAQSEFQASALRATLGIERVRLFDVDPAATAKCLRNLRALGFEASAHASVAEACEGAGVVTTATADRRWARVLRDADVGPGVHVNAIGGDCPGKTELDPAILRRARVVVEYEPQTRVEGEIQLLAPDHPVTELWRVLEGTASGRGGPDEVTVFDSVGFAVEDLAAMRFVLAAAEATGSLAGIDLLARPDDPRDLFALVREG